MRKSLCVILIRLGLVTGVWLIVSCDGRYSADLAIYNTANGKVVEVSHNKWREIVIDASPRDTNFLTLTRLDEPKLIIRERAENGAILSELELPFFTRFYGGKNWIALSSDRKQAIFHSEDVKGLSVIDFESKRIRHVVTNLIDSAVHVAMLRWVSADTVLLLITGPETGFSGIITINVNTGAIQTWQRALKFGSLVHALSESKELLATVEDGGKRITILDVATMQEVKEVPPVSADQHVGEVRWADDDKRLVFWVAGDGVFNYTLSTGEMKRIGNGDYLLAGTAGPYVILYKKSTRIGGRERYRYFLYDVETGKRRAIRADISGEVYGIASNTKLVMEVGY